MTWVRTKLALDRLPAGETLEVRAAGEALENVPRSAREAGHAVHVDGSVISIFKAAAPPPRPDHPTFNART
jgi:TusA-related sulfurtransferase